MLRTAIETRARDHLPVIVRRWIQLATGAGGRRSYAARWIVFPILRLLTPTIIVRDRNLRMVAWTRDRVVARMLYAGRVGDSVQLERALRVVGERVDIPPSATFVDVGANIGNAGLAALSTGRFARVIALEPDPRSVRLLPVNAALNDVSDRLEVVAAAASDVDDARGSVALNPHNFGDNVILEPGIRPPREDVRIRRTTLVRLDRVLAETPGFVAAEAFYWIDVQGHERQALRGLGSLLAQAVGLVVEFSPGHAGPEDFAAIAHRLAATHEWFAQLSPTPGETRSTDQLPGFVSGVVESRRITDVVVFGRRAALAE
jgi:FkbM family methyltransferase